MRAFFALSMLLFVGACGHMNAGAHKSIPWDKSVRHLVPAQHGAPHVPTPLASPYAPEHPFMAPHGASSMHVDPFTTNAYSWAGPLGHQPEVHSRSMGFLGGECPTINFDKAGRIITVCVSGRTPSLLLLEPDSLKVLARHALPPRTTSMLRLRKTMNDTSGGAYFYLDHLDRAVVGTSAGTIEILSVQGDASGLRFELEERIDLAGALKQESGELDKITAVVPGFSGNYWFVGRQGTVGFVTHERRVVSRKLFGEEIENSFSMAEEGAYIVSDHALYHFAVGRKDSLDLVWRETYDRGTKRKTGQINQGSGTTPTILGENYVAIADNAEPRMNVLVYRRDFQTAEGSAAREPKRQRLVCQTPVFAAGQSATENTLIGHGRSLIVENNAGYDLFLTMRGGKTSAPGLARIDIREDESGCDIVWESQEVSQTTVPKLSTATGLIYTYTKLPNAPSQADAYYFTAIDFNTGRTAYRVLTGTGMLYDNNWAAISLAPDGTAFVGVLNGLIRVRDTATPYAGTPVRPAF